MSLKERVTSGRVALAVGIAAVLVIVVMAGYSAAYSGKIYRNVTVDGVPVGGLSEAAAMSRVQEHAKQYAGKEIAITYHQTTLRLPVSGLGLTYDNTAAVAAMRYGRKGSLSAQLRDRLRSLLGGKAAYASFTYNDDHLADVLLQVDKDVTRPVANAQLSFENGAVNVTPSQPGYRFDQGMVVLALKDRLGAMSSNAIDVPVSTIEPSITTANLGAAKHQAESFIAKPLRISVVGDVSTIPEKTILGWIDVTTPAGRSELPVEPLKGFYPDVTTPVINLSLNQTKVGVYVANLASGIDQDAKNAVVAMQDGHLSIAQPSQSGRKLDQTKSVQDIVAALSGTKSGRTIELAVASKPADINEQNLESLGIKEQLSEGQTFFPGSTRDRLTNIRVGAAQFNGAILAPGETFSFGKILGDVGPAQGYVPELVILGNHEEKQYGGGLCQVASTAYRAALLAGLPILERHNHSFAVSYYTAPYGVPGVDATIYYPQVDLKFKNDTGHYMLIQTKLSGTTLTFDYYGTKTKYGEIRGPQFVSGTTDATKASHTVFWRDVKNLDGSLVKTDEINTYYQPSTDFPVQKQFN